MNKLYVIRIFGKGPIVFRNGKPAIYATKELAEKDFHNMPDSWTDYEHYEISEYDIIDNENNMLFFKGV